MKNHITRLMVLLSFPLIAQQSSKPDLSKIKDPKVWTSFNRSVSGNSDGVHLNSKEGDGFVKLNDFEFSNGRIELDIKGKDKQGQSFVGFAFHGLNDSTYDAVYFRPFNFKNPDRKTHSVQYISHPKNPWFKLREQFPDKYENTVNPVPDPDDWFHVVITIEYPSVKIFVNESKVTSLSVEQLSDQKKGWLGFWVGNFSEGDFRNLKITKQ